MKWMTHRTQSSFGYGFVFAFLLVYNLAPAQDITVGIYDGNNMNVNSSFSGGVTTFTPTGSPAQLSANNLNAALANGDVVIETTNGTVTLYPGTFSPTTSNRTLILRASNNIFLSFIFSNTRKIHIIADAGNNCTVDGPGVDTAGGDIEIHANNNICITSSGIQVGGGDTKFYAGGNIDIQGNAISSEGGDVKIHCQNLTVRSAGIYTMGGDVETEAEGNVNIGGRGIITDGGHVMMHGKELLISGTGVRTIGGNFQAVAKGNVTVTGNAIVTTGGDIHINAFNLDFGGFSTGLQAGNFGGTGGNIRLKLKGDLSSAGEGIQTNGGNIWIAARSVTSFFTGINSDEFFNTPGGDINLDIKYQMFFSGHCIRGKSLHSKATNLTMNYGGVTTLGGPVELMHSGVYDYFGHGFQTNGGSFTSTGSDWSMIGTGIITQNGNISLCHTGDIQITDGGFVSQLGTVSIKTGGDVNIDEGGIRTTGMDVEVHAPYGTINIGGGNVNTGFGSSTGGVLTILEGAPGSINIMIGPDLGGGNLLLDTLNDLDCGVFIPTISQWGLIILSLLLLVTGSLFLQQKKIKVRLLKH